MNRQMGFTLIELITVIVILGALAVIALPRYIDLQDEAEEAALEGVAGSLGAAAATNLAGALAKSGDEKTVTDCSHVDRALADGLPADYSLSDDGFSSTASATGDAGDCQVTGPGGSRGFTAYYVSTVSSTS